MLKFILFGIGLVVLCYIIFYFRIFISNYFSKLFTKLYYENIEIYDDDDESEVGSIDTGLYDDDDDDDERERKSR